MASMIFYGVGRNASDNIDRWKKAGYEPVCFVDKNIQKQHTIFEGVEVLSLVEAITKYPDYEIYCTQHAYNLGRVRQYLLEFGIPGEKIHSIDQEVTNNFDVNNDMYPRLLTIYQKLQDDLSKQVFWGRIQYSLSHNLFGVYQAMMTDECYEWRKGRKTYGEIFGIKGLWDVLRENYPIQKKKIYVMTYGEDPFSTEWMIERFLEAMEKLGIKIESCVLLDYPNQDKYKGIRCISKQQFIENWDDNSELIIGNPSWVQENKNLVDEFSMCVGKITSIVDAAGPQYFESKWSHTQNEVFVDVGVYDLASSIDFMEWTDYKFKKIYAFEPDPSCYKKALQKRDSLQDDLKEKIEIIPKGLSSKNGYLDFPAEYNPLGNSCEKTISVETITLDSHLNGEKVTFIKMDVEGAEMDVLQGMSETIKKHKPRIAVCIYHKHEDIFEIAEYLLGLVPEYKLYLRHYNSNELETVLFCEK